MVVDSDQVKKEAKEIMDNFMSSLNDIDLEEEFSLKRKDSFRDEDIELDNQEEVLDFKNRFLSNAQKIKGDAIIANKGSWVK